MSDTTIHNDQTYKLLPVLTTRRRYSREERAEVTYAIFAFTIAVLLICLGLRVILSLFVITGTIPNGLVVITDPAVLPFTRVFDDAHEMLQGSTALAFTTYYGAYYIISPLFHFARPTSSTTYSHELN